MKKILIIGATSAIAEATARLYAEDGDRLALVARNRERLDAVASDLRERGADSVACFVMDANDFARHEEVLAEAELVFVNTTRKKEEMSPGQEVRKGFLLKNFLLNRFTQSNILDHLSVPQLFI